MVIMVANHFAGHVNVGIFNALLIPGTSNKGRKNEPLCLIYFHLTLSIFRDYQLLPIAHGRPQTFFQGRANFSGGGGKNILFA